MEHKIRKKIEINCTLDSSELVMLNEGGMHKSIIKCYEDIDLSEYHEFTISFQLENGHLGRFKHVSNT